MANINGIGFSPITDKIYLGKQNPEKRMWVGKKEDITNQFISVAFLYFEVNTVRTIKSIDDSTNLFINIKNDNASLEKIIKYLSKLLDSPKQPTTSRGLAVGWGVSKNNTINKPKTLTMTNKNKQTPDPQLRQTAVMQSVIATDLRIGNYIQFASGSIYPVDIIYKDYTMLKNWFAIPLTDKWLEMLGFQATHYAYLRFHINLLETEIYLRPSLDKWYWGFVQDNIDCEINDCYELAYVHEIQNLIFSLTRISLTVA